MNAATLKLHSSELRAPAASLRRLLRGVRQYLPTVAAGDSHRELACGYEQMAGVRSRAGDERGAAHLEAHATALRDSVGLN